MVQFISSSLVPKQSTTLCNRANFGTETFDFLVISILETLEKH